jgi:hypothetical protein
MLCNCLRICQFSSYNDDMGNVGEINVCKNSIWKIQGKGHLWDIQPCLMTYKVLKYCIMLDWIVPCV